MRFSACIEWLFAEAGSDYAARLRAAAAAGLDAVEFWGWSRHDLDGLRAASDETGVRIAAICAEPFGVLRLGSTADHDAFVDGIRQSCAAARRLGGAALIVQSGRRVEDLALDRQMANLTDALARAGHIAAGEGITLLLEPINSRITRPDGLIDSTAMGLDVVASVGQAAVRLLFDRYHSAVMEESVATAIGARWPLIGHVHVADDPGRNEPGSGQLDWEALGKQLGAHYGGLVGFEYRPTLASAASVAMAKSALSRSQAADAAQQVLHEVALPPFRGQA